MLGVSWDIYHPLELLGGLPGETRRRTVASDQFALQFTMLGSAKN